MSSAVLLSAVGQEDIFSICCNTGDFLKVIYYNSDYSSCLLHRLLNFPRPGVDVTLAELRVGACRSGKKENSLRKTAQAPCLPDNEGKNTGTHL
jgi:hypothetical protein